MGDQPMAPRGVIAVKEKENIKGHEWGSTTSTPGTARGTIAERAVKTLFPNGKHVLKLYRPGVIVKWDGVV